MKRRKQRKNRRSITEDDLPENTLLENSWPQKIITTFLESHPQAQVIPISDIVMMQMVGDFDSFLTLINENDADGITRARQMIEETRAKCTTPKLFPSIVRKTIEAQFGEKHAALREEGQNGLDSYGPLDLERVVTFSVREEAAYLTLRAEDHGCGMDRGELVRNLLVPYNSGKEFDPTKIGEHGIGWYSIVDLATVVEVDTISAKNGRMTTSLIYRRDDDWVAAIAVGDKDKGDKDKENKDKRKGTTVLGYISLQQTTKTDLIDHLYLYLGLVDPTLGSVQYHDETVSLNVNSVRNEYRSGIPTPVVIGGRESSLLFSVASAKVNKGNSGLIPLVHRRPRGANVRYTQRGLFVKDGDDPFNENTLHAALLRQMANAGIDFWVDLPAAATLTKGRNNVVAEDMPAVVDGMYRGFQSLFLDVILKDEEIMSEAGDGIAERVGSIFREKYLKTMKDIEAAKYSWRKRAIMRTAATASKAIDIGELVLQSTGKGFVYVGQKMAGLGVLIGEAAVVGYNYSKKHLPQIAAGTVVLGAGTYGLAEGAIALYHYLGLENVKTVGKVIAGGLTLTIAGYIGVKLTQGILELRDDIKNEGGLREYFRKVAASFRESYDFYDNVDEKRNRKREKLMRKISGKYLARMEREQFLSQIMNKDILPAVEYVNDESNGDDDASEWKPYTLRERMDLVRKREEDRVEEEREGLEGVVNPEGKPGGEVGENENSWASRASAISKSYPKQYPKKKLRQRDVRLSIDSIVQAHLQRKLRYVKNDVGFGCSSPREGDYDVDYSNPLISAVVDLMEQSRRDIGEIYHVRVLEDHLENLVEAGKSFGLLLYFVSGIGFVQMVYTLARQKKLDEKAKTEEKSPARIPFQSAIERFREWRTNPEKQDKRKLEGIVDRIAYGTAVAGYSATVGLYNRVLEPSARSVGRGVKATLDVRLYPDYVQKMKDHLAERRESKKWIKMKRREINETLKLRKKEAEKWKAVGEPDKNDSLGSRLGLALRSLYRRTMAIPASYLWESGTNEHFEDVGRKRLERIAEITHVGYAYIDFIKSVEAVDNVIAQALDAKPLSIRISSPEMWGYARWRDGGFSISKKRVVNINIGYEEAGNLLNSIRQWGYLKEEAPEAAVGCAHQLFDRLLHIRTHDQLKNYKHLEIDKKDSSKGVHDEKFYPTKDDLRRKVIAYCLDQNIDITMVVEQALPSDLAVQEKPLYIIAAKDLADLVYRSRSGLVEARMEYDSIKKARRGK